MLSLFQIIAIIVVIALGLISIISLALVGYRMCYGVVKIQPEKYTNEYTEGIVFGENKED